MTKDEAVIELKNQILAKRPVLARLFKEHAGVPISEYHKIAIKTSRNVPNDRKQEFIVAIKDEVKKHFSGDVAESVAGQLEKEYFVSTAEHHGPLTHPFFVHSNLLAAHAPSPSFGPENIVILAVGSVSLNNSSYPRGIIFHSRDGVQHHLPFFPSHERMSSVFGHRAFTGRDLEHTYKGLDEKVKNLVTEIYGQEEILKLPDFSHQIVKTNDLLWQKLFSKSGKALPRLITLQIEDVVLKLLKDHHLFGNTEIHNLLFNEAVYKLLLEYADGIPGNFSIKEQKGTFLFWYRRPDGKRQALWQKNNSLVAQGGYSVQLDPAGLAAAMELGELIPGTFLSLLLLSEYYGVKCLGGFSQGTYLGLMHEAYNKIMGRPAASFDSAHSSGLRSDFVLAHLETPDGEWHAATGIDLALHNSAATQDIFLETINKLSLEQAMLPLFPELYPILYPEKDRDANLLSLNTRDIINFYGLSRKIRPCIILN